MHAVRRKLVVIAGAAAIGTSALASSIALVACGSSLDDASSPTTQDAGTPGDASIRDSGVFADGGAAGATIEANAIVLVHAASFPAFRVCFEGRRGDRPEPSTEVMPDSNVVGVEVGTAVRLDPKIGVLGRAYVFAEADIRALYPTFGGDGPTCNTLLTTAIGTSSIEVGEIEEDVSSGVHALVLTGCRGEVNDTLASTQRCGDDWEAKKATPNGNLQLRVIALQAFQRLGTTRLSFQIVQLSPGLGRLAAGRAVGVSFGALDTEGGAPPSPFVEGSLPFGKPVPNPPAVVDYSANDVASYATSGVFVTLGGAVDDAGVAVDAGTPGADAGARELVFAQSLADIQKRSSPRSLPAEWFGVASSYVVITVGEPAPRLADGGTDDDPRRALHLLAIPLAEPDAGPPRDD